DASEAYAARGAAVFGISADTTRSHQKFTTKFGLNFPLLSDPDHSVASAYDSWGLKKFMGREYHGVKRNTFLIDEEGKVARVWESVKPDGHADEVLAAL
ncbi:MAG TPA: peroxiredoxin, partial [Candidatus Dormibacteraeota bacterium]|nr:peroxiredoxin [Candidatus Dormibacteraeota bacterium]